MLTSFALLLHELTTNAAEYGALATFTGNIDIECTQDNDQFVMSWSEHGGPPVTHEANFEGFGTLLARATVQRQLGGEISHDWRPEGLTIRLAVAKGSVITG